MPPAMLPTACANIASGDPGATRGCAGGVTKSSSNVSILASFPVQLSSCPRTGTDSPDGDFFPFPDLGGATLLRSATESRQLLSAPDAAFRKDSRARNQRR